MPHDWLDAQPASAIRVMNKRDFIFRKTGNREH